MPIDLRTAHRELWKWCRAEGFAGYDPYDSLNSRWFQATPFKNFRWSRLVWTQFHKRAAVNFRPLVRVPRERNAKGIALFALAALADYRRSPTKEAEIEARELLDDLMWMRLKGFGGACWGYNFDWQSRNFFLPRGTPTIVPTAFAARALCEAAQVFGHDEYLPFARTICDFILQDLNRSAESSDEVCFSYSPRDHTQVLNASLLAAETLATVGALAGESALVDWAVRATRYVVRRQREDGSWNYGSGAHQHWADNFHTAFILTSLSRIMRASSTISQNARTVSDGAAEQTDCSPEFSNALERGYEFWKERFFLENGWPKYFADQLYPADIHSAASAIVALVELADALPGTLPLAKKIGEWGIANLRDSRGYFYYQRRRFWTNRIAYMRWSQAWTVYALARFLEASQSRERPIGASANGPQIALSE